jgi:hypothetical protein
MVEAQSAPMALTSGFFFISFPLMVLKKSQVFVQCDRKTSPCARQ